ncbi:hypothetical protein [Lactiplantibacillus plantarum]|uniref:hypothetical protein n=1 Tax=Lactiplantibacillus plantarum TaxID=1590 RepID=UPI000940EDB5|nr:hypothetical protein [Lactiplantibacillus plantarum]MBC6382391.1 hypothetical protein [Lactiplantibacillus plantarum]
MFITILGWIIIVFTVLLCISMFLKNEDGTSNSISQKILTIVVSVLVIFFGLYLSGHSKRVNEAKQESISSSRKESISQSKEDSKFSSSEDKESSEDDENGKLFIRDFNVYLSNKKMGTSSIEDGVVKVVLPNSVENMSVADFTALAQEIYDHANTLASGEDYDAGIIYFYSQNGGELARSTFSGGIKIYKE